MDYMMDRETGIVNISILWVSGEVREVLVGIRGVLGGIEGSQGGLEGTWEALGKGQFLFVGR